MNNGRTQHEPAFYGRIPREPFKNFHTSTSLTQLGEIVIIWNDRAPSRQSSHPSLSRPLQKRRCLEVTSIARLLSGRREPTVIASAVMFWALLL